jgi:hypothetical protein
MSRLFIALASILAVSLLLPAVSAQAPLKLTTQVNAPFQEIAYNNSEHHIHLNTGRYVWTAKNTGPLRTEDWVLRNGTVIEHDSYPSWTLTGLTVKTAGDYVFQFNGQGVFSVLYGATIDGNGKNETTVDLANIQDAAFAIDRGFPHIYVCALATQTLSWSISNEEYKKLAERQGGKEINYTYTRDAEYYLLFIHLDAPGNLNFTVTNVPCTFPPGNLGSSGTSTKKAGSPASVPFAAIAVLAWVARRRQFSLTTP